MSEVEERLARSLTAESADMIPYLPYLLQDLWEVGSQPGDIVKIIRPNVLVSGKTRVLDLACGKGAVSVRLAREFGCYVKGIDLIPEFIACAKEKAAELGVGALCEFEAGDINEAVRRERDYDIVLLCSAGEVLGDQSETVSRLKNTVKPGGYMVIDDAYGIDQSAETCYSRKQWICAFSKARVAPVAEKTTDFREIAAVNSFNQRCITRRANELKSLHPEKADMFERYVRSQQAEIEEMERCLVGVTWLLRAIS